METSVSTDVALLDSLDSAAREVAVTSMLDQARQWLERAKESTTPAQDVAQFRAFVATVAEAAKQKKLSEDIQLDAVEMVRRSERALGVAIRQGQERGEIATRGQGARVRPPGANRDRADYDISLPTQFAGKDELSNSSGGIYDMTDNVTEEEFDTAITAAKEEGNLSRANVVRKVQDLRPYRERQDSKWERVADLANSGYTSPQIAREVGMSEPGLRSGAKKYSIIFPADAIVGKTRRIDPLDVLERIIASLEGDETALDLVSYGDVTPEQAAAWLSRLASPLRALKKMQTQLKEIK